MDIFAELTIVIVVTAIVAGIARLLKQPLTAAYIVAGFILAPFLLRAFDSRDTINIFSEMGIAILLFIVGLHLSPREVKDFGKQSFLIGLFQVLFTAVLGFYLSLLLGFHTVESIYIGVALSFSSTIIVLKIISDKKDLEKLYGRIAIGVLLFQDIVAGVALIFASAFSTGNSGINSLAPLLLKGLVLVASVYLIGSYVLPKFGSFFAKSQEYLMLFSIAWGFGLAALFRYFGFSLEIGALIAGVALSVSPYSTEISSRLKPLRDFFVVMFFVSLGSQVTLKNFIQLWPQILSLTLFVLVAKTFIVTALMGQFGYNKKTSFLEGVSLAQISEFSLVLVIVGFRNGHIGALAFATIITTGVISIALSSYLILYVEKLYPYLGKFLRVFERRGQIKETSIVSNFEVILFGCNRVGYDFIRMFKNLGSGFLAVDFDPTVIATLDKDGINCVYGDAEDAEFLEEFNVDKARIVVSTIPDFETGAFLLSKVRATNKNSLIIVLSYSIDEALKLYDKGASYVILPHFITGEFAADMVFKSGQNPEELYKQKLEHLEYLKRRRVLGHSHPVWAHNF